MADASWVRGRTDQEILDAMLRANADRARLARLVASGVVRRDETTMSVPGAHAFVAAITALAFPNRSRGLDTIRPNRKKAKKRK